MRGTSEKTGATKMAMIKFDGINFNWDSMLKEIKKRKGEEKLQPEMEEAAKKAYNEGVPRLKMQAVIETFDVDGIENESLLLSVPGQGIEKIHIGPKTGYLMPAEKAAVIFCTVGSPLVDLMQQYEEEGDYLTMYYLDVLGVKALAEVAEKMRRHVEEEAVKNGWGVGPFMQPGSVDGWTVEGQRDLFRLARPERIGLRLNDSCFLLPRISDSALIGMGAHYDSSKVGSMCHECPRREQCLWRRENAAEN